MENVQVANGCTGVFEHARGTAVTVSIRQPVPHLERARRGVPHELKLVPIGASIAIDVHPSAARLQLAWTIPVALRDAHDARDVDAEMARRR